MKRKVVLLASAMVLCGLQSFAQKDIPKGWHLLSPSQDSIYGVDMKRAYDFLRAKNKKSNTVIVAVLDSGVDTLHEDLKPVLWKNPKEIPGNGLDDDKDGLIDDVYGWNFLGGKDGKNVNKASDEKSRVYHRFKSLYEGKTVDTTKMSAEEKYQYTYWKKSAEQIVVSAEDQSTVMYLEVALKNLKKNDKIIREDMKKEEYTIVELEQYAPTTDAAKKAKMAYLGLMKALNVEADTKNNSIITELDSYVEGKKAAINAKEHEPINYRTEIIKDDYNNIRNNTYGNRDVMAGTPTHGTHVSGIIGAVRDNQIGIQGAADNVQIMTLRVVPDGDEYDKDIALAIIYAVDHGAKVINMSFGKSFSPEKKWVDSAVRYAASKDVLLVHAAGNERQNTDVSDNFPNPYYLTGKEKRAANFLTVGASSDPKIAGSFTADFSNYGKETVDIFAPGVKIYSTLPGGNQYGNESGTSMASPLVAGVAAVLRSYYPQLTAVQTKEIIEKTVTKLNEDANIIKPGTNDKVSFSDLCRAGGIVNAYEAVKLADTMPVQATSTQNAAPKKTKKKS